MAKKKKKESPLMIPCCVYIFRNTVFSPEESQKAFEAVMDDGEICFGGIYHRFNVNEDTVIVFYDINIMKLDGISDEGNKDLEFYNSCIEKYMKEYYFRFDTSVYKQFCFTTKTEFLGLISYVRSQEAEIEFRVLEVKEVSDVKKKSDLEKEDRIMKELEKIKGLDITYNKTLETLITGQMSMCIDKEFIADILLTVKVINGQPVTFLERVVEEIKNSEAYQKRGIYTHQAVKTALGTAFLEFITEKEGIGERKEKLR